MSAKSLFLSRLAKITGRDKVMRSSIVFGSLVGLALAVGCSRTHSQYKAPNNVQCGAGSCSVPKPVNPANIDFEVGESDDHEVTIPVAKIVKRCADGMVFVEGEYCPVVQETCLYFVDIHGNKIPETKKWPGRCGEYKTPTKCLSNKLAHKEFCIDQYEYPNIKGHIPQSRMSWYDVKASSEKEGKRLCTKSEWTFSCEGPEMHPYPYGDGFHRDTTACNFDQNTKGIDVFSCTPHKDSVSGRMVS